MNRFDGLLKSTWAILMAGALAFAVVGCEGDTGPAGPPGPAGQDGQDGQDGAGLAPVDMAKAESCATCHNGVGPGEHQSVYDLYVKGIEASAFEMTFTSFTAAPGAVAGEFDGTLNVTILKNGLPYQDLATLTAREGQAYFAVVDFDGPNQDYSQGRQTLSTITQPTPGNYVITGTGLTFDPTVSGQVYGYIAENPLLEHPGGTGGELPVGTHVHLYENVANAAIAFGDAQAGSANEYQSAANVAGCVKCHGEPYAKHGYRLAEVAGLPAFSACKTCHYSGRNGFLSSLQFMVDDPLGWATGGTPPMDYTYEGSIMNDTHMAHAMEFPYPQSMQNCATCHEGKISTILADTNFTAEVCQSCHPVNGINAKPTEPYNQPNRAPALAYLWSRGADLTFHDITSDCQSCHGAGVSSSFTAYHTGYDVNITNAAGERYEDLYTVSIDAIAYDATTGIITVDFSSNDTAIVPELYVSFYGWNTKHFIAPAHERDANDVDCPHSRRPGCNMEYVPESAGGSAKPMFTEDAASVLGDWRVAVDPSLWQLTKTDDIPTLIADGVITRFEVTVTGELNLSDLATPGPDRDVVLTAANETFDLVAGAIDDDWFKAGNATVDTAKCNACHDALASSFHSESGRAGDGIEVCKNCHNPTFAGSHLEFASRSIDSYVHAIHSFQDFDVGDTFGEDGFDPVFTKRYDMHIKHVFPNFTIRNCEACHVTADALIDPSGPANGPRYPVVYNVPDQTQSMPGALSQSDVPLTWYEAPAATPPVEKPEGRNVGFIPEYVTGSASRACGGCHRARLVRDDAAGALTSFNAHTEQGGTLVENDADDENLYDIIFELMESVQ